MENCKRVVSEGNGSVITTPDEALRLSVAESQSPGSSTVLVSHFDGQVFSQIRILYFSCLGGSLVLAITCGIRTGLNICS